MNQALTSALAVPVICMGLGSLSTPAYSQVQEPITNLETGETVQLVRAYWNGNRDIAGSDIQCSGFVFNTDTGQYEVVDDFVSNLRHESLPFVEPNLAFADFNRPPFSDPDPSNSIDRIWEVVDGEYFGPMTRRAYNNATSGFIELIESSTGQSGIRVWDNFYLDFRDCYDTSGAALTPTGFVEEVLPPVQPDERSLIVTGSPAPENPESIINLETGEAVQLTEARFDVYQSFWQRRIVCIPSDFNGSQYIEDITLGVRADFLAVNTGPRSGIIQFSPFQSFFDNPEGEWMIVDGHMDFSRPTFNSYGEFDIVIFDQVEVLDGEVRSWISSERFVRCSDGGGFVGREFDPNDRQDFTPLDPSVDLTPAPDITDNNDSDSSNSTSDDSSSTDDTNSNGNTESMIDTEASSGGGTFGIVFLYLLLITAGLRLYYVARVKSNSV